MEERTKKLISRVKNKIGLSGSRKKINNIAVCASQVPFTTGGAEEQVSSLIRELRARDYNVDLINIPFKWYPHEQIFNTIKIWQMLDLTESDGKQIDLVIATKFPSYFINHPNKVLWLTHQYRQAYDLYHSPHSGFRPGNKKHDKFRKMLINIDTRALSSFGKIYTISQNTADRLKKYNGFKGTPLYPPPKGINKYRRGRYDDYILSVGRLDRLKRVDLLIESLKYCSATVKCKIAGTGPELNNLKDLARQTGVSDRIEFLGFVSEEKLIELYANCAFVFFAPIDEDYGYITVEAFLSGKGVITSFDSGGALEFVSHGENGFVLNCASGQAGGESMEQLYFDRKMCQRFGQAGFEKIKNIDWDYVINCLVKD